MRSIYNRNIRKIEISNVVKLTKISMSGSDEFDVPFSKTRSGLMCLLWQVPATMPISYHYSNSVN